VREKERERDKAVGTARSTMQMTMKLIKLYPPIFLFVFFFFFLLKVFTISIINNPICFVSFLYVWKVFETLKCGFLLFG
jgi:hypothetical protein